ncbi:hypothetical protein RJ639_046089 [Escallonia herrerae]|uniref:Uncharacterized protein n=1 Tax=Escallonia herrerae TaxID=1293975 RepID=A0AA88W7U6_9ASTE|nr:hypothetical protein RJ639_046089 [Escallonia herrerae]
MMNMCAYQQQNAAALGALGEISASDAVVCPKPRRIGVLNPSINDPFTSSSRWHANRQAEVYDARSGSELLDMILTKGSYGSERSYNQVASSPPFFSGSPPTRASNPVIQDAQFGNDKPSPLSPAREASPSPSARKSGGCARVKYGQKPAAVRIEGFNCRGSCSISAVA